MPLLSYLIKCEKARMQGIEVGFSKFFGGKEFHWNIIFEHAIL